MSSDSQEKKKEEAEPSPELENDKTISFSYQGEDKVLKLKSEVVDRFEAQMIDYMHKALEAFDKQIFDFLSLGEVKIDTDKAWIKDLNMYNFSSLRKNFVGRAEILRQNAQQKKEEAKPLPEGANDKTISFSYRGKGKVLKPKSEVVDRFKAQMIGHMRKALEMFDEQIFSALMEMMIDTDTGMAPIKDLKKCNFSSLRRDFLGRAEKLRQNVQKDKMKFEIATELGKTHLRNIREAYQQDWSSKKKDIRQRAIALYLIDKLALRVGGCCSLRVEHIKLHEEDEGQEFVEFDFLGKDSIRYQNKVPVDKRVFKAIKELYISKNPTQELFDEVNPDKLNKYLQPLMLGLTNKVFRTCHASNTLQDQLNVLTLAVEAEKTVTRTPEKRLALMLKVHRQAVKAAAVLCNHQRAIPKTSDEQMAKLKDKIKTLKTDIKKKKEEMKSVKNGKKASWNKKKKLKQLVERKRKVDKKLKEAQCAEKRYESNVTTTIKYYLDPRITVAWCKKWEVPVEKIYSPALMQKFKWAIDMAEDYEL